jgi:hypothetical protein
MINTKLADVEYAWAAGFLDGEACIGVCSNGHSGWALRVRINQVEPEALHRLARITNTKVIGPRKPPSHTGKPYYILTATGRTARGLLELTWPYLTSATKAKFARAQNKIAERGT